MMKIYTFLRLMIKDKMERENDEKKYGLCLECNYYCEDYCEAEEMIMFPFVPRKYKCKYFERLESIFDRHDVVDYLDYLDNGVM